MGGRENRLETTFVANAQVPVFIGHGAQPIPDYRQPDFGPSQFRPDIEGLRAIAVVSVLLFHLEIGPFDGGFVGVDVFFVLSGYLITSLMARQIATTGGLALAEFWARRARRLLPASALVILFVLIGARLILDPITQQSVVVDAFAACFFVINIVFGKRGGDYFAVGSADSPLLHFWSLAVEEQFYLVWPVVLYLLAKTGPRRWLNIRRVCATLAIASLALCLWMTPQDIATRSWAFNLLPSRAWELLAGALLALSGTATMRWSSRARSMMGWIGLGGIVAVIFTYTSGRPLFPGWAAIVPVVATLMVVAASDGERQVGPAKALGNPVMIWLGARSYAIYLWHWPLWVFANAQFGELALGQRVLVGAASIGAAMASYRFVENPVRKHPSLTSSAHRSLNLGGGLIAAVAAVALMLMIAQPQLSTGVVAAAPTVPVASGAPPTLASSTLDPTTQSSLAVLDPSATTVVGQPATSASPVAGPVTQPRVPTVAALVQGNVEALQRAAATNDVPGNLRPGLGSAGSDKPSLYNNGCILEAGDTQPPLCIFGDSAATETVVLFGDSHAAQWFPAFSNAAAAQGWRLEVHTKRGCPTAAISLKTFDANECARWRANVAERLAAVRPSLIVMTAYRYQAGAAEAGLDADQVWKRGLDTTLSTFRPLADQVLILGDSPTPRDDVIPCLASHLDSASACVRPASEAVKTGRLTVESDLAATYDALFEPTSNWLCTADVCPVIIGDILVYRDHNHITTTASNYLTPYVEALLLSVLNGSLQ